MESSVSSEIICEINRRKITHDHTPNNRMATNEKRQMQKLKIEQWRRAIANNGTHTFSNSIANKRAQCLLISWLFLTRRSELKWSLEAVSHRSERTRLRSRASSEINCDVKYALKLIIIACAYFERKNEEKKKQKLKKTRNVSFSVSIQPQRHRHGRSGVEIETLNNEWKMASLEVINVNESNIHDRVWRTNGRVHYITKLAVAQVSIETRKQPKQKNNVNRISNERNLW